MPPEFGVGKNLFMERISVSHFVLRPSVFFLQNFRSNPPPRMPVTNKGFFGLPTKHGIILVVTVTAWGVVPSYTFFNMCFHHHPPASNCLSCN